MLLYKVLTFSNLYALIQELGLQKEQLLQRGSFDFIVETYVLYNVIWDRLVMTRILHLIR